mgnify:FL=1
MSIVEDYQAFMKHRWLCVYGASVAIQVHEHMREGRGAVDIETMQDIKEEARAIADLDAEGESR